MCLDVVVKITRFIIGKTNMKSSSAAEASLSMLANTTRDKNYKGRKSLIQTYKKLIARTIIIILLHFYFIIHTLVSYAPANPKRRPTGSTLLQEKSKLKRKQNLAFI